MLTFTGVEIYGEDIDDLTLQEEFKQTSKLKRAKFIRKYKTLLNDGPALSGSRTSTSFGSSTSVRCLEARFVALF